MYQRLDSIDWSFLLDKEVLQVCIGQHDVQIHMSSTVSLGLESRFEHKTGDHCSVWDGSEPDRAVRLVSIIGHSARIVNADNDMVLTIEFDNNDILRIFVDDNGYESFSVTAPGRNIFF